jgi:hypothetical protein
VRKKVDIAYKNPIAMTIFIRDHDHDPEANKGNVVARILLANIR